MRYNKYLVGISIFLWCSNLVFSQPIAFVQGNGKDQLVHIRMGKQLLSTLNLKPSVKKPFWYPLNTHQGIRLCRAHPFEFEENERVDHPHHVGMWFNYGAVNGTDFWNNSNEIGPEHKGPFGTIEYKENSLRYVKPNQLRYQEIWKNEKNQTYLLSTVQCLVDTVSGGWSFERQTTLLAQQKLQFDDSKEGLFALRLAQFLETADTTKVLRKGKHPSAEYQVNNDLQVANGKYFNSEKQKGLDCWGKPAKWVCVKAKYREDSIAVLFLDHPKNIGHPTRWHARWYGLFSANNLGSKAFEGPEKAPFKLNQGQSITLKHRIIFFQGNIPNEIQCDRYWIEFATKPHK